MTLIWTGMVAVAMVCGVGCGRGAQVASAAVKGAQEAVELALSMAGVLCLWSGVMEVMGQSGLVKKISRLLRPVLGRIFWQVSGEETVMENISANVTANLLGLGNAATPPGVRAVQEMGHRGRGRASDAMCMLVVCNTASIQLLPTTVAAVRASQGCETPFDIVPAVWLASVLSVAAGITACRLLARVWKE